MTTFHQKLSKVKAASRVAALLPEKKINAVLRDVATEIIRNTKKILQSNQKDLTRLDKADPLYARLELTEAKIRKIAADMTQVARLPSTLGRVLEERTHPNKLKLTKVTVPLGVIGVIYESRPNVTADVFALCLKAGSACVLKGGKEAAYSSAAITASIQSVLRRHKLNPALVHLVTGGRAEAEALMRANGLVDVIIPRGGANLIRFVREHSTVPVIETGAGVVHTFLDETADLDRANRIIYNAKTSRPAVCNALDTLLVHVKQLSNLAKIVAPLLKQKVELFADARTLAALKTSYPKELLRKARPEHYGCEFLSLKLAIKTVKNLDEAIGHINRYGSGHSEAILSRDRARIAQFLREVDAAVVYANTSTRFTDGAEFGLGAEIGISTQKLHARGPMGLESLVSYKWIVQGEGQIRV